MTFFILIAWLLVDGVKEIQPKQRFESQEQLLATMHQNKNCIEKRCRVLKITCDENDVCSSVKIVPNVTTVQVTTTTVKIDLGL
jgi:hypothetical protein